MHSEIDDQFDRLSQLFDQANDLDALDDVDDEVKSHFTFYLCVLTSGYIESSLKTILREYMGSRVAKEPLSLEPHVRAFVENNVNRIFSRTFNPSRERVLDLLSEFSDDWKDEIKSRTKDELGAALDSIVSNRNNIVHGENSDLTLPRLRIYFGHAQEVVKLVYEQCNPADAAKSNA